MLDKQKLRYELDLIMEEINVLHKLDHPNIVNYFETYDSETHLYLVMEYIGGMDLFDKISHKRS